MSFGLFWKVDKRALVAAAVNRQVESALDDAAEYVLETANRTVPIEEGTLEKSGGIGKATGKRTVYYDTPYARRQHEELGYRHDSGRRAKFLEKTMQEEEKAVTEFLRDRIGKVLK
ncbi:MAG: hypothetical protein IBX61_09225 [Thermoleophilia bacterium]|nr:hypothetical protein [Thermoleophilia bacterium]